MEVPRSQDGRGLIADPLREGALEVLRTLRAAGFEALFAGGCVRDQVLGKIPKDWDIATSARPEEVMGLFEKSIPVGVQFGVVRIIAHGHEYEVATFRADGDYADHRRPASVSWASAREDVLRRDFTINGLLQDPLASGDEAGIIDFVGGLEDLGRGVIRAIGEPALRFEEDHLRLLRAVRFSARFGFEVEAKTLAAVVELAPRIVLVSAERIGNELTRLLSEGGQAGGFRLLAETGLLSHILPELGDQYGREVAATLSLGPAALEPHEFPRPLERALARLSRLGHCEAVMGFGALLWEHPELVEQVATRLRLSRAMGRDIQELIEAGHRVSRWQTLGIADKKRVLRLAMGPRATVLAGVAGHREESLAARAALAEWASPHDLSPPALVNGADLKGLGFLPGPAFRVALEEVETAQLEGRVDGREAALAMAKELMRAQGGSAARR